MAAIVGALFIRFAAKFPEKKPVLDYWLQRKFPQAAAQLTLAMGGYTASVTDFERIAPAVSTAE